jgi:hypothetical protein
VEAAQVPVTDAGPADGQVARRSGSSRRGITPAETADRPVERRLAADYLAQLEIRADFEPSAGTRQVDQHFWVFETVLASSSLESDDQTPVGA